MKDHQVLVLTPRKRGRPRAPEPGTNVQTWLRESEYDRLCEYAQRQRMSVSSLVRRLVVLRLPSPD